MEDFLCDKEIFNDLNLENVLNDYCQENNRVIDLTQGIRVSKKMVNTRRREK